jgi:hypothetical protein
MHRLSRTKSWIGSVPFFMPRSGDIDQTCCGTAHCLSVIARLM